MSRPTWKGYADLVAQLRRRNKDLSTRLAQVEKSRDKWRVKALERGRELERFHKRRRRKSPPRTYTVEQWRQHELIVARIRAIPVRDIL